jgi:hypothetical protein
MSKRLIKKKYKKQIVKDCQQLAKVLGVFYPGHVWGITTNRELMFICCLSLPGRPGCVVKRSRLYRSGIVDKRYKDLLYLGAGILERSRII